MYITDEVAQVRKHMSKASIAYGQRWPYSYLTKYYYPSKQHLKYFERTSRRFHFTAEMSFFLANIIIDLVLVLYRFFVIIKCTNLLLYVNTFLFVRDPLSITSYSQQCVVRKQRRNEEQRRRGDLQ